MLGGYKMEMTTMSDLTRFYTQFLHRETDSNYKVNPDISGKKAIKFIKIDENGGDSTNCGFFNSPIFHKNINVVSKKRM